MSDSRPKITQSQPRNLLLRDFALHDYVLPTGGPINATMTEIIVLLPNWFRNRDIAVRFQNNGINGGIHFAIFKEHHDLALVTATECERARDRITDQYRRTMRLVAPTWTKATQKAPNGWNENDMVINNFLPDAARQPEYITPASVPFKSLAVGLKKLPSGTDAGDLTRALDFAMKNQNFDKHSQGVDFMFPDDLQLILDHIGRTKITSEHTDPHTVRQYSDLLKQTAGAKAAKVVDERRRKKYG
ncbi:uncharacterized protein K460DRAFT_273239, partial [Cucurbitaria berberidis CBS 394.84]